MCTHVAPLFAHHRRDAFRVPPYAVRRPGSPAGRTYFPLRTRGFFFFFSILLRGHVGFHPPSLGQEMSRSPAVFITCDIVMRARARRYYAFIVPSRRRRKTLRAVRHGISPADVVPLLRLFIRTIFNGRDRAQGVMDASTCTDVKTRTSH